MVITQENAPERWALLERRWKSEAQPALLASGSITYQVVQSALTGEIEFRQVADLGLMGSSSMAGVVK